MFQEVQSKDWDLVNHTFSGVALAHLFDLPPEVIHLIAVHSRKGDLGSLTTEGWIVNHADFIAFVIPMFAVGLACQKMS